MIDFANLTQICKNYFYYKNQILDKGQFGTVYRGYSTKIFHQIAVKHIELKIYEQNKELFINQRKILSILAKNQDVCQCICKLYDYDLNDKGFFLFLEYCQGKRLKDMIQEDKYQKSMEQIMLQLLSAINNLHKANIIHKDIKPENIIVQKQGKIKIVYFGATCTEGLNNNYCLTPNYASFELLTGTKVDKKCDIWSLGIIFYEMCVGYNIYESLQIQSKESIIEYLQKYYYSGLNLQFPPDVHPQLVTTIIKILIVDAQSRHSLNMIKNQLTKIWYSQKFINRSELIFLQNESFENKLQKLKLYTQFKVKRTNYLIQLLKDFKGNVMQLQFHNFEKYILMFLTACAYQKAIQKLMNFFKPCRQLTKTIFPQILNKKERNQFLSILIKFIPELKKILKQNLKTIQILIDKIKNYLIQKKSLKLYNNFYKEYEIIQLMDQISNNQMRDYRQYLDKYHKMIDHEEIFIYNQDFLSLKLSDKIVYINMRIICYLGYVFPNQNFQSCSFDFIYQMKEQKLNQYIKQFNKKQIYKEIDL